MAQLTYNSHTLPFQLTEEAAETVVMSDDGADYLYTEKSYSVQSVLTPALTPPGLTFPQWIARLQHDLEQPRCSLRVDFGGGKLVQVDGSTDCKNGPTPQSVRLVQFAGADTCVLLFTIKCAVRNCDDGGQILSNRWTESVSINGDTFLTQRTRQGKLVIRPGPLSPDSFRHVVTPPTPTGFVQSRSDYQVQSDGLALSYTIVHQEQMVGIPPGAIRASGEARVTAEKGIWKYAEVSLTLSGDKRQNKQALLELAILVAMDKLDRFGRRIEKKGDWKLLAGAISEKLYDNQITVNLKTLLSQPRQLKAVFKAILSPISTVLGQIGDSIDRLKPQKPGDDPRQQTLIPKAFSPDAFSRPPLGSEPEISPDFGLRSTAGLQLVAAALSDPCLRELVRQNGQANELVGARLFGDRAVAPAADQVRRMAGKANRELAGGNIAPPAPVQVQVVPQIPQTPEEVSDGGLYTDYRLNLEIQERTNQAELPEQRANGRVHFVKLAGPTVRLKVRWKAERIGEPPEVPQQDLGDPNAVFLEGDYSPGQIEVAEDGVTLIHTSAGEYTYGFKDPAKAKIGAGMPPWVAELVGVGIRPVVYDGPPGVDPGSLVIQSMQRAAELVARLIGLGRVN